MNFIAKLVFFLILSNQLIAQSSYLKVTAENGLYLRYEASTKGDPIALLPQGIVAKRIGTISKGDTINSRKGSWIEVECMDTKGWAFDGYLVEAKDSDRLVAYAKYLERLNTNDLKSAKTAELQFKKIFKDDSIETENAFRLYRNYIRTQSSVLSDVFKKQLELSYDNRQYVFRKDLLEKGFIVYDCEGTSELLESFSSYNKILKSYTFRLKDTILLLSKVGDPYACDAGIGLSWEAMRINMHLIETYLKKNKSFSERTVLENLLSGYAKDYAIGMDNTPVCDFTTNILHGEAKSSYEVFLQKNKSSRYYSNINKLFLSYKKNKFKCSEETRTMVQKLFLD